MKTKLLLVLASALCLAATTMPAADPAPANPAPAGPPARSAADNALKSITEKVQAKANEGKTAAADYAPELKALEDLAAAHQKDGTETAPQALYVEAVVKIQVLSDLEGGAALLERIATDFPHSQVTPHAAQLLSGIKQQIEAQKISAALKPGIAFPDFQEKDLSGRPMSVGMYKGKIVLVDFWATWCGPCVRELPNVLAAYKKYHAKGFEIAGISLDQEQGTLEGFIGAKGMDWPEYFDGGGWENKLSRRYGVASIPANYLLDRNGVIVAKDLRGPELEAKLAELLGK